MAIKSIRPKVTPEMTRLNFVLMTPSANYTIPLREAEKLWHHPHFDRSRNTEILVTGWTSNINKSNSALETVWQAYKCRGGVNFVVSSICLVRIVIKPTITSECRQLIKRYIENMSLTHDVKMYPNINCYAQ